MNTSKAWVMVCVLAGLLAGTANAVNIELVPVGNLGNAADTRYVPVGHGAVPYWYRIGKYEVTAGQYTEFLNAVAKTDTYVLYNPLMWSNGDGCKIRRDGSSGSYMYKVAGDYANRPVNYVSWGDAARFSNWLHNGQPGLGGPSVPQDEYSTEDGAYFLNGATTKEELAADNLNRKAGWRWAIPTEDEWYKAAYYDGVTKSYFDYPTRRDTAPGRDMADPFGNNANYWPYPIDPPYYTTVAGEFQNSASPYGTFDQGGNVWEWNEYKFTGVYRGMDGGAFSADYVHLHALNFGGVRFPPSEFGEVGFRLVDPLPEPGTMGILALGGVGMLVRRKGHRG